MDFVAFSDPHGLENKVELPGGDVLLCCGDVTHRGELSVLKAFADWMAVQDYSYKVMIAGNHDFCFENKEAEEAYSIVEEAGIIYLEDSSIDIGGLKIYGSPWQPYFFDWAFNVRSPDSRAQIWASIPEDVDILMTHCAPFGILDRTKRGDLTGCSPLLERVKALPKLKYHIFGHIHEAYGQIIREEISFLNCSVLNERYKYRNPAVCFSL